MREHELSGPAGELRRRRGASVRDWPKVVPIERASDDALTVLAATTPSTELCEPARMPDERGRLLVAEPLNSSMVAGRKLVAGARSLAWVEEAP